MSYLISRVIKLHATIFDVSFHEPDIIPNNSVFIYRLSAYDLLVALSQSITLFAEVFTKLYDIVNV